MFQISPAGVWIRAERPNLHDQIGGERVAAGADFRPFFGVLVIGKTSRFPRAGLNKNFVSLFCERRQQVGSQRTRRSPGKVSLTIPIFINLKST